MMHSGVVADVSENRRRISSLEEKVEVLLNENSQIKAENEMLYEYLCQKDPNAPFCQK